MYTVSHFFIDNGVLRSRRWTMRQYKTLRAALNKANSIKGGFVSRYGSNDVTAMGEWTL